ncbi:MAG: hypothetical protein IJZ87_09205 [Bacteroidales bacterium]|nr:hypothetical protein [Bacteroidales bacterium]
MKKYFVLIAVVCGILFSCKPDPKLPSVGTHPVTEVTAESAVCSGEIWDNGNAEITAKGFCWSTNQNPTLNDNVTTELSRYEPATDFFTATIRNLKDSTTYYVRAFATNEVGTAYGSEQTFTTLKADDNGGDDNGGEIVVELPAVTTVTVSEITDNTASIVAEVLNDGGAEVTERGFYWNEKNVEFEGEIPLNDNKVEAGSGAGQFNYQLTDLKEGTEYRVMAYATNDAGTSYGEIVYFTTEKNEIVVELPTVSGVTVSEISFHTATITAEVLTDGGAEVTERGFIWSKAGAGMDNSETIEPHRVKVGEGLGSFTYLLTGLSESTVYYVNAYAINSAGEVVSDPIHFTTEADDVVVEYEYVDLGLPSGVKWAMHNVGTSYPEGHGDHFAWGEIEPKDTYESGNCSSYYKDLGDISGNPLYDAAAAKWGNGWRMPTLEEMYELTQECTWTWVDDNGIVGYKVTSKTNGNYIFLPAAGFRVNGDLIDLDVFGYYWMSTPYEEEGSEPTLNKACFLDMCSYQFYCNWSLRRNGMTIRPVKD